MRSDTKRCAVITDAAASGYLLPAWIDYYGGAFGYDNLIVVCYQEKLPQLEARVVRLLSVDWAYSENLRVELSNNLVQGLLQKYSIVIRVDVDEFLVPDPRKYPSLRHYVDNLDARYVTAIGLDVVEMPSEAALRYDVRPLLKQRGFAVKGSAYSKTCVTTTPLRWSPGFHTVNAPPIFDDLYLFHMKFSDASTRSNWLDHLAELCKSDPVHHTHFKAAQQEFTATLAYFQKLKIARGDMAIRDRTYVQLMEKAVRQREDGEYYYQDLPATDFVLCEIPNDFASSF